MILPTLTVAFGLLASHTLAIPTQPLPAHAVRSLSGPQRDAFARSLAVEILARRGLLEGDDLTEVNQEELSLEIREIVQEKRLFGLGQSSGDNDQSTTYAPYTIECPSNTTYVREASGISAIELEHITTRRNPDRFLQFLSSANLTASDLNLNLTSSSNTSASPNVALAFSGGGYRAMINGAGGLWGTDSRHPESVEAGTGEIGQAVSYMAGLSGGSWMVGSYYANGNNTPPYLASNVWNLSSNLVLPDDGFFDTVSYYTNIVDEAYKKKSAGYNIQITDVWALALSDHLFPDQYRAANTPNLTIADLKGLSAEDVPYPIVVAVEREPNTVAISLNATVWEFSYNEFGTWGFGGGVSGSEARHPGAFVLVEYMGTSLDNGSPNSTSTEQCVRGFDNLGFVVGTSSTLFNEGFLELNSTSEDGVLITAVKAILADVGSAGNDVATIPNPFIGWKPETNPTANWSDITLVDGGESNQNIPLEPFAVPARGVDAVFAFDNSADTTYAYPNGTALYTTGARFQSLTAQLDTTSLFPYIPSENTFVNLGLNQHPTFFGCDTNATPNTTSPLVIYVPNYPWSSSASNSTTFTLEYSTDTALEMIANGARTLTLNNTVANWSTCLACAMADRAVARGGNNRSEKCIDCFSTWCWNGTVNDTTPSYEYEPIVGTPPAFLNTTAKDASSESGENSTSSSSSGSTKSGAGVTISTGVSLAMFGAMFAGFLPLFI